MPEQASSRIGEPVHSTIARMLQAADRLPVDLRDIFRALFVEAKQPAQVCKEMGLSADEFEARRKAVLRNLRAAVA